MITGLFSNLKTPRGKEILFSIIFLFTLASSKLPPPKSATSPSTELNPKITPVAEILASSSPDKTFGLKLNIFSTSVRNGSASVASLIAAVAIICKFLILEISRISLNLFKTFNELLTPSGLSFFDLSKFFPNLQTAFSLKTGIAEVLKSS